MSGPGEGKVALPAGAEQGGGPARGLARLGRGRLAVVDTHRDVAPALSRLLADWTRPATAGPHPFHP